MTIGRSVASNVCEMMRVLVRIFPDTELIDEEGFFCIRSEFDTALLNAVLKTQLDGDLVKQHIVSTETYFRGKPWRWWVYHGVRPNDLKALLHQAGYKVRATCPGMAASLASLPELSLRPDIELACVSKQAKHFNDVVERSFDLPAELGTAFEQFACAALDEPQFRLFVGYCDGEPATSGMLFLGKETAGIYNVGTLAEYRGRGLGTAMTSHLMQAAHEQGYATAVLTPTSMSHGIYSKLGFQKVIEIEHYGPAMR